MDHPTSQSENEFDNSIRTLPMVRLVEDDGPADWLDRFYTLIRVALLLMLAFNYASTGKVDDCVVWVKTYSNSERFVCAIIAVLTIALYQGGYFQLQRRLVRIHSLSDIRRTIKTYKIWNVTNMKSCFSRGNDAFDTSRRNESKKWFNVLTISRRVSCGCLFPVIFLFVKSV